ncbi:MAG TPA: GH36 C-terminal domain-containing protein, partial [Chitinophagaceae bacterium]|nr:GH36 C-terminal domain-containing protein [Chitinophagaceae bacterium]
ASMGKLGFDIVAGNLNATDLAFCQDALKNYNSFKHTVWQGDLYRLLNPHENRLASLMYVSKDKGSSIMFNLLVNTRVAITATELPVQLAGLDAAKKYRVKEINLYPGTSSLLDENMIYSGDFLMKVGINPGVNGRRQSVVLEIKEAK